MLVMLEYIENRFDGTIVAHPISSFWLFQDKMLSIALKTVFKNNFENNGLCYCEQRLPSFKMIATDPEESVFRNGLNDILGSLLVEDDS